MYSQNMMSDQIRHGNTSGEGPGVFLGSTNHTPIPKGRAPMLPVLGFLLIMPIPFDVERLCIRR